MTEESLYDEPDFGLRKKAPPQPEEEEIVRDGYLQKAGRILKGWKRRWFILTHHKLLYYKSEGSNRSSGEINIDQVNGVSISNASSLGAVFQIKTKSRTYTLAASSEEIREEWMTDINKLRKSPQTKWHLRLSAYGELGDPSPYASSRSPVTQRSATLPARSSSPAPRVEKGNIDEEAAYAVVGEKPRQISASVREKKIAAFEGGIAYAQVNKRSPSPAAPERIPSVYKGTCDEELKQALIELGEADFSYSSDEPFELASADSAFKELSAFLETLD